MKGRSLFLVYGLINLVGGFVYLMYCLLSKRNLSSSNPSKGESKDVRKKVESEAG
jgi:hypothetical protein